MVETDKRIDLRSEHAPRPVSVPGLWWCKGPIVGIGSGGQWWKSPVTDLPGAVAASPAPVRIARRRGHLTPWTTPVSMSFAANGDGFIAAALGSPPWRVVDRRLGISTIDLLIRCPQSGACTTTSPELKPGG